jgi:hypothetical protein
MGVISANAERIIMQKSKHTLLGVRKKGCIIICELHMMRGAKHVTIDADLSMMYC